MNVCLYNNTFTDIGDLKISPNDRAFQYGDGVFETIIFANDNFLFYSDHLQRLKAGLQVLSISMSAEFFNNLEKKLKLLLTKNNATEARIKLIVWRKTGGLFAPTQNEGNYLALANQYIKAPEVKLNTAFADSAKLYPHPLSNFKTLSSASPYILAGIEKNNKKVDDIILLDHDNHVAEGLTSNIFWIKDSSLFTPSLETGCIAGIVRHNILEFCQNEGIKVFEEKFSKKILLDSDTIFLSNVAGISALKHIDNKEFKTQNELLKRIVKFFKDKF
ncbi:MAG: aminotransferase class IV [Cytophagaceae bacterium]